MRIIFMGTPEFAVPCLNVLVENGYEVVAVITATDKMGGRGGKELLQSDVKKRAVELGIPVLQPEKLKNEQFLSELRALNADLQVVVAFRMLPEVVWAMPKLGTINLHGSLLPKYRGAAPINWAVMNGDKETGLTTFFIEKEIDTGKLLFQSKTAIGEDENVGEVHDRLKIMGSELMLRTVKAIESGNYEPVAQDNSQVSHAPKLFLENTGLDFSKTTQELHNFVRGLSPYPAAWTKIGGEMVKIYRTKTEILTYAEDIPVGTIINNPKRWILAIKTVDGRLHIEELQPAKRKKMTAKEYLNGNLLKATQIG